MDHRDGPLLIHSMPTQRLPVGCESILGPPPGRLRGHVLGYAGFGGPAAARVGHRLLPITATTLVLDFAGGSGLVTGVRGRAHLETRNPWGYGVTVALTPAGVRGLLGVPSRELAGETLDLAAVLGARAAELTERLAVAPGWPDRWRLLDQLLTAALEPAPDDLLMTVWRRLHAEGRLRIGAVAAALGVSRRRVEVVMRDQLGLSPGMVARIARLQRATGLLARGSRPATAAATAGFADQAHLTREMRALGGLTPGELCAILQDHWSVRT